MNSLFDLIPDEPTASAPKAGRKRRAKDVTLDRQRLIDRWLQGQSLALQKVRGMSPADADGKALADWQRFEAEEAGTQPESRP